MKSLLNKPSVKTFISSSVRATTAAVVAFATKPEIRKSFADHLVELTNLKNAEMLSKPAVHPQAFMLRLAVKNASEMVELYTVYSLDECSSEYLRVALEKSLVIAAEIGGITVADILNTTGPEGLALPIVTRIRIALSNTIDNEDSPVKALLEAGSAYLNDISSRSSDSSDMSALFGQDDHFSMGLGGVKQTKHYTNEELSFVK